MYLHFHSEHVGSSHEFYSKHMLQVLRYVSCSLGDTNLFLVAPRDFWHFSEGSSSFHFRATKYLKRGKVCYNIYKRKLNLLILCTENR